MSANSFFNIVDETIGKVNATKVEAEILLAKLNADIDSGKFTEEEVAGYADYCNRVINRTDIKHPEFPPYPTPKPTE